MTGLVKRTLWTVLLVGTCAGNSARAHFLWLFPAGDTASPKVCFSEEPGPGEANLIDKVAATKVWSHPAAGKCESLKTEREVRADLGWWKIADAKPGVVEAHCDYGVITRGGETFSLQYNAKHAPFATQSTEIVAASSELKFDVAASKTSNGLRLRAVYEGKPAPQAEFTLISKPGKSETVKANDAGEVDWQVEVGAQPLAIRAKHVQAIKDAKVGEATEVRYYATLVLSPEVKELSAADLLTQARAARAVWNDFHGFSADFSLRIDEATASGRITLDENGDVAELELSDPALRKWLLTQLSSLVQHRLPSFDGGRNAKYADEKPDHPLGRKIILGDEQHQSVYRIKGDVVAEVNRQAGNTHFTISVLETERNAEGKYLPRTVSMTTWDNTTKEIKLSQTVSNSWQRVGKIDLPARIVEIETGRDSRSVKELVLTKPALTAAKK